MSRQVFCLAGALLAEFAGCILAFNGFLVAPVVQLLMAALFLFIAIDDPIDVKTLKKEKGMVGCYEVYSPPDGDAIVFKHSQMDQLLCHIELLVDYLEDGAEVKIVYRKYTQQEFDEVETDE
jgi:hypothetical protein